MNAKTPIQRACAELGSMSALARAINVAVPTVHQWITGDRPIPAERCIDIERATGGKVRCEELRPDQAERISYLRSTTREPA